MKQKLPGPGRGPGPGRAGVPAGGGAPPEMQQVLAQAQCIYDRVRVDKALDQLAVRVTLSLAEANPVLVCVMTGGLMFAGDLLARLHFPLQLDYLHATRYREQTRGAELHWLALPRLDLQGRVVLLLDDILDEGLTLAAASARLTEMGAAQVQTAVLVEKMRPTPKPIQADYVALQAPDLYLFGRGMDYKGYWRNLDAIYAVAD